MAKPPRANTRPSAGRTDAAQAGPIVPPGPAPVKPDPAVPPRKPGRPRTRRQSHGSAWHWWQTDGWYYTLPGTKRRVPLFDEDGTRIRGKEIREQAGLALARVKLAQQEELTPSPLASGDWVVARVCSEYLQSCDRRAAAGSMSQEHCAGATHYLNDLCRYCGALPVAQLKKGHIRTWVDQHKNWKSPATERSVLTIVVAAFNYCQDNFDVPSPLMGLKKPAAKPRRHSLSREDEEALLMAADPVFRDFLFAAIRTGLRPFSELAKLTAEDVEEAPRGTMWRGTRRRPRRPGRSRCARR